MPQLDHFSPDGRYGAVSNSGSDDSSIIDTRTRREVARVKVGKGPKRLLAVTVPLSEHADQGSLAARAHLASLASPP